MRESDLGAVYGTIARGLEKREDIVVSRVSDYLLERILKHRYRS